MTGKPSLLQKIYEMMIESQHWPSGAMQSYQRSQLVQLLRHARDQAPFYRQRLDPVLMQNGEIDWSRWNEIPIVTRVDLRDRHDEMLASALPPGHGPAKEFRTSGSTGVPIRVLTTSIASTANRAAMLRFLVNQNMDMSAPSATIETHEPGGASTTVPFRERKWGASWISGQPPAKLLKINRAIPDAEKLALLREHGVKLLYEITNNAELLARTNAEQTHPAKLDILLCIGQGVSPALRGLVAESFGARAISLYSSKEAGVIGCQCRHAHSFHMSSELGLVEILDADGRPCAEGQSGRVVVTPFFSTALPLIRYDQGDTAAWRHSCGCGHPSPVIESIGGRSDDVLHLPDGPRNVGTLLIDMMEIDQFALAVQIAQISMLKIELRYVPKIAGIVPPVEAINSLLRARLHPSLEVSLQPMETLPLNSGGKQQRVIRLFS
jgi:phenylacetate-CoA ligase